MKQILFYCVERNSLILTLIHFIDSLHVLDILLLMMCDLNGFFCSFSVYMCTKFHSLCTLFQITPQVLFYNYFMSMLIAVCVCVILVVLKMFKYL